MVKSGYSGKVLSFKERPFQKRNQSRHRKPPQDVEEVVLFGGKGRGKDEKRPNREEQGDFGAFISKRPSRPSGERHVHTGETISRAIGGRNDIKEKLNKPVGMLWVNGAGVNRREKIEKAATDNKSRDHQTGKSIKSVFCPMKQDGTDKDKVVRSIKNKGPR